MSVILGLTSRRAGPFLLTREKTMGAIPLRSPGFPGGCSALAWGWAASPPSWMSTIASRVARARQPLPGAIGVLQVVGSSGLASGSADVLGLAFLKAQREPWSRPCRLRDPSLVKAPASVGSPLMEVEGWWSRETRNAVFSDFLKS